MITVRFKNSLILFNKTSSAIKKPSNPIFFFGHHKCASQYMIKICETIAKDLRLTTHKMNWMAQPSIRPYCEMKDMDIHLIMNSRFHKADEQFEDFRGFHLIRDPRDMIVSGYFSHLYSHPISNWPQLAQHREALQKVDKDTGIMLEIDFEKNVFNSMLTFTKGHPSILEVTFEEMTQSPFVVMKKVFSFCELMEPGLLTEKKLKKVLHHLRFKRLAKGRKQGQEDSHSHYRKGVAGDWKNHFTADHKAYFKEQYSGLLVKLGYESDDNW